MTRMARGPWFKVKAWVQRTPALDTIPMLASFTLVYFLFPPAKKDLTAFYAGISALAGILMSSITFTIMLAYGSDSELMKVARKNYRENFSHNWLGMIVFSLLAALLPLLSILVDKPLGQALAVASVALILSETARCIFWVRFTLLMDSRSAEQERAKFTQADALESIKKYGQSK
ncbi:hypothetical protein BACT_0528 [Bifidobacterium actinocoloniiforme DSM 22766]|uniref:Uncharacterized protein n=1 Tax=Bifidobacterium actinocoloniiforme DSM 22766 TaxID=1437605 RepID=A0A086YZX7_9BIFI|nr:hypothetical protein [Bifidobacterium actinocoloniiforme]AKV55105.1 hypothetical protein AB656_01240 [Bifidobacterium actinocoloniiforme DSM 22766]KFI39827.1 hypothetical protein BACT_0528 [Bifidobacterium actinocoloniiforme DSM 22766]